MQWESSSHTNLKLISKKYITLNKLESYNIYTATVILNLFKKSYLIFSIGVILVNGVQETVPFGQRQNVDAVTSGEVHGQLVKRVELIAHRFVEETKDQNRRVVVFFFV